MGKAKDDARRDRDHGRQVGTRVVRDRVEKFPADGSGGQRVGDQDTAKSNREHDGGAR